MRLYLWQRRQFSGSNARDSSGKESKKSIRINTAVKRDFALNIGMFLLIIYLTHYSIIPVFPGRHERQLGQANIPSNCEPFVM